MKKLSMLALIALIVSVPAYAATRHEHHFKLTFSSKATGSPSGAKFLTDRFAYKAPALGQKADRVATLTFVMQPGTKSNPNAYPACSKSKLLSVGSSACPKGALVGSGSAVVITGLPAVDGPSGLKIPAQVFATRNGLLTYLVGQQQVIPLTMKGNRMTAEVPRKCLPADCSGAEVVLKTLTLTLKPGKIITTPAKCPASHKWTNSVLYKYVNGDTEKETSTSPCKG